MRFNSGKVDGLYDLLGLVHSPIRFARMGVTDLIVGHVNTTITMNNDRVYELVNSNTTVQNILTSG